MKQLSLPLNWTSLWEQNPYWRDSGRMQGWIMSQQQKLSCGWWVQHKDGQVGRIHTIHGEVAICSTEFKEDGSTKKSARWYIWDVAPVLKRDSRYLTVDEIATDLKRIHETLS